MVSKPTGKKTGRPTRYNPEEHPKVARLLTGNGKTLADVAEYLGVNPDTINEWRKAHPLFSVAIDLGKEDACDRVARALFERAVGYEHPAVKILAVSDGSSGSHVEKVPYVERYPPDPAAARFFLTNRRAKEWRERQEVEHSGEVKLTLEQALAESLAPTKPADA
jgi:transcriptional regulator with XRE-family HTH domain